jgi:oligopeptide/dipeptide ABC transporter ATP-binding protein
VTVTTPAQHATESLGAAEETVALEVEDLNVDGSGRGGDVRLVCDVSFTLRRGEVLGLVGESGSGKTMTALALLRLIPTSLRQTGAVRLDGRDLGTLTEEEMRAVRGRDISMIFQDPNTALNPVRTIGSSLREVVRRHTDLDRRAARQRVLELLRAVGIPSPEARYAAYPHQLSGGLCQRAVIAMALLNRPAVIVADEPTTALDTTIQAQILDLLRARLSDAALLLITHDLGVAAELCDRVAVMYAGRIVEMAPTVELLAAPRHHYTAGLLAAAPRFDPRRRRLTAIPGQPPNPRAVGAGCAFAPRCPAATAECVETRPPLATGERQDWRLACWHPLGGAAPDPRPARSRDEPPP